MGGLRSPSLLDLGGDYVVFVADIGRAVGVDRVVQHVEEVVLVLVVQKGASFHHL